MGRGIAVAACIIGAVYLISIDKSVGWGWCLLIATLVGTSG